MKLQEVLQWNKIGSSSHCAPLTLRRPYFLDGATGDELTAREVQAKQICRGCPVIGQCRDHAVNEPELHGNLGSDNSSRTETHTPLGSIRPPRLRRRVACAQKVENVRQSITVAGAVRSTCQSNRATGEPGYAGLRNQCVPGGGIGRIGKVLSRPGHGLQSDHRVV